MKPSYPPIVLFSPNNAFPNISKGGRKRVLRLNYTN